MCTTFPFSLSLEGWADLPGDSAAEPTWKSSNVLPSMLPLTCSNAQLNRLPPLPPALAPPSGHPAAGEAASCQWPHQFPLDGDVKNGKADRCPSKAAAGLLSSHHGSPSPWRTTLTDTDSRPALLPCRGLGLCAGWPEETPKSAPSYWRPQSSQALVHYKVFFFLIKS